MVYGKSGMLGLVWLCASAAPCFAAANLITNGGFEAQTYGGAAYSGSSQINGFTGYSGGTNVTGWTNTGYAFDFVAGAGISGTTADTTGAGNLQYAPPTGNTLLVWGPDAGGGSVANGLTLSPAGGSFIGIDSAFGNSLSQSVSGLTAGYQYQLQFYWASGEQYSYSGATTDQFQATFSDGTTTSSYTTNQVSELAKAFSGWMLVTTTFKATSATEVLNFVATGGPNGTPPMALLDGVSLSAVPEPASWAAMVVALVAGCGGAGLLRRRGMTAC